MERITRIERKKDVFKMTQEEFISGEWLKDLKEIYDEGFKFDVSYSNGFLTTNKFLIKKNEK